MYCSIAEAWGNDFGKSTGNHSRLVNEGFEDYKTKKKHKKRRGEHSHSKNDYLENMDNGYNSQKYERKENKQYKDPPFVMQEGKEFQRGTNYIEGDGQNRYSFSRGLARLPDHNGPEVRQINQNNEQEVYQQNNAEIYEEENNYREDNYEEEEIIPQERFIEREVESESKL